MNAIKLYGREAIKSPVTWVVGALGMMLLPLSMYMAQHCYVPGIHPQGPWIALFMLLTAVPQMLFSLIDPLVGYGWRQSQVTFYVLLVLSGACDFALFGIVGFGIFRFLRRAQ